MICVTSKCCFCAPLWLGLLTWAYIKLIFTAVSLVIISYTFLGELRTQGVGLMETVVMCYVVLLSVFCVIFLIGLYYRNYKFLLAYYLFSVVEIVVGVGCYGFLVHIYLSDPRNHYTTHNSFLTIIVSLVVGFVLNIVLPCYFMVLIRSELLKLKAREDQTLADICTYTDLAIAREHDKKYNIHLSNRESQEAVPNAPIYPVDNELERMIIQQLRVQNV